MNEDICFLTIAEAAQRFRAGTLTPTALTRAILGRIESVNPKIDAYLLVMADDALAAAARAEKELGEGHDRGPMHGIPVALKDNIETKGVRTTAQSRVLMDHIPDNDAVVVARLKEAGAVILGKLACLEFAHGAPSPDQAFPPVRNPWRPERGFTGGSSTGSGAAVAAGLALAALGTDTGGSIRGPAALCGTAGLMPTYGRVSRRGIIPYSWSLDHCGPLAWTARDCGLVLGALAGFDSEDPGSAEMAVPDFLGGIDDGVESLRIGVLRHFFEEDAEADKDMVSSIEAALEVLAGLGAVVEDARARPLADYHDVKLIIGEAEFYAAHEADWLARAGDFGASLRTRTAEGAMIPASDYIHAQRARRVLAAEMDSLFDHFDVLVTASVFAPPPPAARRPAGPRARQPNPTQPFNVAGNPAISVATGFNSDGLPLAMQIAGRAFDEKTILRFAHAYEQATPHKDRRPAL
jgi:aspartyl-tRNA(Asn)/glutamyl-tRNA(Gln) amidotransferase subunit A